MSPYGWGTDPVGLVSSWKEEATPGTRGLRGKAMCRYGEKLSVYTHSGRPQEKPALLTPWSGTSSLQDWEKINFYGLWRFVMMMLETEPLLNLNISKARTFSKPQLWPGTERGSLSAVRRAKQQSTVKVGDLWSMRQAPALPPFSPRLWPPLSLLHAHKLSGLLPWPCLVAAPLRKAGTTQQPPLHMWCSGVGLWPALNVSPNSSPRVGIAASSGSLPLLCLAAGQCLCDLLSLCVCPSR